MENKNKIIIPMIIGILVLVVAVVGVTFAFFSAENTASGTTTVEATTESIGVVTVSNPSPNLHLNLLAYEMQESQKGTSYWATTTSERFATSEEFNTVATYSITGGAANTKYACRFSWWLDIPDVIEEDDMTITLKKASEDIYVDNFAEGFSFDDGITEESDLKIIKHNCYLLEGAEIGGGAQENDLSYCTLDFEATGNSSGDLLDIAVKLNNTTSEQNHIAGENLSITFTMGGISCNVIQ